MNIYVSGGAGYIGTTFIDYVLSNPLALGNNVNITVYDNLMYKPDGAAYLLGKYKNLKFINGDVRDTENLLKSVDGADVVIPLAALVGMPICEKDKNGAQAINADHVYHLAQHCQKTGKKLVGVCTNSGYGTGQGTEYCTEESPLSPVSVYGITKCAGERHVLGAGGVSLRLATAFGVSPRMRLDLLVNDFTFKAVTDGYIVLFEKDFKRNYVHVRDIASAFCFAIKNYDIMKGQAYNLGLSDANLSKWELANKIKEHVPNFSIQVDDIREDPDKRNYIVSNEKIEKLGWKASVSLDEGIEELIRAYSVLSVCSRIYGNA